MDNASLIWAPVHAVDLNPENARTLPFSKHNLERTLDKLEWSADYLKAPRDSLALNQEESLLSVFLKRLRQSNDYSSAFCDAFESIASLAAAIGSPQRLIQPITATKQDNRWIVSSGNRRLLAHVMMGAEHVKLLPWSNDAGGHTGERALLELQENLSREDLSLADELTGVQRVLDLNRLALSDLSINSLQRLIGWTNRTRAQRIKDVLSRELLVTLICEGAWSELLPAWQARHESDAELMARLEKHRGESDPEDPVNDRDTARERTRDAASRILKIGGSAKHQPANKLTLKSMVIGHHAQGLITEDERDQYIQTIEIAGKDILANVLVDLNQLAIQNTQ